jgi:peptide/nickel transport system substrate-binding protein/oligopeptide transport system substrate-binding protein
LGNGPYYITEKSESELVLTRNELYWDVNEVEIPKMRILFQDEPEKITERFNQGEIDWAADGMILDMVLNKDAIVPNSLFATSYFYFNCSHEPWDNPLVREGLTQILPWDKIRDKQFMLMPAATLVPQIPGYPKLEGIEKQDIEKGKTLLEKAGYTEGRGLSEVIIKIPAGSESRRIAKMMKTTWEEQLQVSVAVQEYMYPQYYNELESGGYTLGTITWIGDFPDPLTFLQMWTAESNLNDAQYRNTDYDETIKESMSYTGEKRYEKLADAERILLQQAVVLPIHRSPAFNLIDLQAVRGWFPNPLDIHPLKFIHYAKPQVGPGIVKR